MERQTDAALEAAAFRALVVEHHEPVDVGASHVAPIRALGEPRHDAFGAGPLFVRSRRATAEDESPGRRVGDARDLEGAENRHALQVLLRRDTVADSDLAIGQRVIDRTDQVIDIALELPNECRGDSVRTRGYLNGISTDVQARGLRLAHPPVDGQQSDSFAVERDFDLIGSVGAAEDLSLDGVVRHEMEDVLAVRREDMDDRQSATGTEGCSGDPFLL